ncbi:MAG: hypothetical protein V5A34_11300 [Halapricum sp.]
MTAQGESLEPLIAEMRTWGQDHLMPANDEDDSVAST